MCILEVWRSRWYTTSQVRRRALHFTLKTLLGRLFCLLIAITDTHHLTLTVPSHWLMHPVVPTKMSRDVSVLCSACISTYIIIYRLRIFSANSLRDWYKILFNISNFQASPCCIIKVNLRSNDLRTCSTHRKPYKEQPRLLPPCTPSNTHSLSLSLSLSPYLYDHETSLVTIEALLAY